MTNKIDEIKSEVTGKVVDKVSEKISQIVIDKINEIGEFSCEDMTINLSFKNIKISAKQDNEYQHPVE